MRWIFVAIILWCQQSIIAQYVDHPVISEIRYHQHSGVNEEFVEIYNPTDSAVSLEGWRLVYKKKEGGNWTNKEIFTSDHIIPAYGFFLWGGDACETAPDIVETSSSALGLSNSGGHVALLNPEEEVVDLVAWEGGDSPEGSGDAGETETGGALERKASENSTAGSMASGGSEEKDGNGYDTDDNANDFVVHPDSEVHPQNSLNSPEPPPHSEDGTGSATISPTETGLSDTVDIRITMIGEMNFSLNRMDIIIPENWKWSQQSIDILFEGSGLSDAGLEISGDTLHVSGMSVTATDSGIVTILSAVSPDTAGISVFKIMTSGIGGTLKPIRSFPSIVIKQSGLQIIQLHQNDAMGQLTTPFFEGQEVTVSGIVTAGSQTFSSTQTEVYIQDETAGIALYSSERTKLFSRGDSVTVTGILSQYKGMTEIVPDFENTVIHSSNYPIPEPMVLTCAEVNATFQSDYTEPNEGRLVRINRVTYNASNSSIEDSTGETTLYIDLDTDLHEPTTTFDVIGILKQYAEAGPPFKYGYEIVPRDTADILPCGGPQIVSGPDVVEWGQDGVTLHWITDVVSSGTVYYGETRSYGDSIRDETPATEHWIDIEGLESAHIYHYRICSEDSENRNFSGDRLFITISDLSSKGEIHVYFNGSVVDSIAKENVALGDQDLANRLGYRIGQAKYSIDGCFMKLTEPNVRDSLIAASQRGVQIRFICDDVYFNDPEIQELINAGIPVISDAFGSNEGEGIMHNKFAVFDHRNDSAFDDDWVWTGSYNLTYYGSYPAAKENAIEIQDQALAEIYTREFEEMWGSESETPDPLLSRFGYRKMNNIPHTVPVNEIPIHPYMSPSDRTTQRIIEEIQHAHQSLYFCIFSFTHDGIGTAMTDKLLEENIFRLSGVFDTSQKESNGDLSEWERLSNNPSADVLLDKEDGLLHHKYLIADGDGSCDDPVVVTGSHNWSTNAETINDENTLIIHDADIANQYLQEFAARYYTAEGTGVISSVEESGHGQVPSVMRLSQNYPNPFNSTTQICYSIPCRSNVRLAVFDVRGRFVSELDHRWHNPGNHTVSWDGTDSSGKAVSSGIYFVRMKTKEKMQTKKLVLMR